MDPKVKEALLLNRIKILKFCDYFIVTAPLISRKILPMEKHKEFKNRVGLGPQLDLKAANNARLDSLLEYLDDCSTPGAFDAFLEGVKECEGQKNLAKILKKMADGGKPPKPRDPNKPKKSPVKRPAPTTPAGSGNPISGSPTIMKFGSPTSTFAGPSSFTLPSSFFTAAQAQLGGSPTSAAAAGAGTAAPKKPKKEKGANAKKNLVQNGPIGIGVIAPTLLPPVTMASPAAPSTPAASEAKGKAGKQNQTPKPRAPKKTPAKNQLNGQTGSGGGGIILKLEGNPSGAAPPKKTAAAKKKPGTSKIVLPKTTLPLTGIFFPNANTGGGGVSGSTTAKSPGPSTSTTAKASTASTPSAAAAKSAAAASAKKPFVTRVPAGSPFRRRATNSSKLKKMSFREVEEKQKSATRATTFSFVNPSAVVKTIHFNNKSDLFYEGCPSKTNNQLCAKKVQLKGKGKKYVCKDKHENESYELFPRLYVTFQDDTTHMQTTLYRENVEVLAGKPVPDIHKMDDEALKGEFLKAHFKNIPIEVKCKKILKKEIKKAGGATWDNVATIITEDDGPTAAKRSRKSTD